MADKGNGDGLTGREWREFLLQELRGIKEEIGEQRVQVGLLKTYQEVQTGQLKMVKWLAGIAAGGVVGLLAGRIVTGG